MSVIYNREQETSKNIIFSNQEMISTWRFRASRCGRFTIILDHDTDRMHYFGFDKDTKIESIRKEDRKERNR